MALDENGDFIQSAPDDWFAGNQPPYDPYHDPSRYAGYDPNGQSPLQQGGYSTAPPIDTATGQYPAGWSQGPNNLWNFSDPTTTAAQTNTPGRSGGASQAFSDQRPGLPDLSQFKSPDPLQPWTEQFNAPTAQDSINSPGFQFRLGEGLKALQRSAAAKGTLLTGGTMKGLQDYAQNQATTQYQQDYNNAYNTYDSRRTNFLTNEANRYNSQRSNLNDQWGISSDYFNQGSALRQQDFNIFDANRNFDFGVTNADRNFGRGLNQDYSQNLLNLALLGRPPAPVLG